MDMMLGVFILGMTFAFLICGLGAYWATPLHDWLDGRRKANSLRWTIVRDDCLVGYNGLPIREGFMMSFDDGVEARLVARGMGPEYRAVLSCEIPDPCNRVPYRD